jgi:hypothetical protein
MLMSGVNVATHVANYLNLGELDNTMNSINKETGEIMAIVSQYWKTIEKEVV